MAFTAGRDTAFISIHAPARGATRDYDRMAYQLTQFQSTLPRGERRKPQRDKVNLNHFNPRSREGSDSVPCYPWFW